MRAFLEMGGYGAYVWSAFGVTAVAMVGLLLHSLYLARRRTAELEELRRQRLNTRPSAPVPLRPVRAENARPSHGEQR